MPSLAISSLGAEMASVIVARDNGIHRCFKCRGATSPSGDASGNGVTVRFGGRQHPDRPGVADALRAFRGDGQNRIQRLLPFQVEAILNMVYRPETTFVSKTMQRTATASGALPGGTGTLYTQQGNFSLESPDDDIGMMTINDLYTGSGKTLTSITAALLFAAKRGDAIQARIPLLTREQVPGNWSMRMSLTARLDNNQMPVTRRPQYTNAVIVMCAKHLISQWKSACLSAFSILGIAAEVLENPMPRTLEKNKNQHPRVIILHSTDNLVRLGLECVPAIIVDEFTVKSPSNVLTKPAEIMPVHGRLILVSADAGSVQHIMHGAHHRSLLRRTTQWDDARQFGSSYIAMAVGIPLISASILQTKDRRAVGELMVAQLRNIRFEKYTVEYTPSFASRLFGSNFEMSALSGTRLIWERFGIDLAGTKTVGQVLQIVRDGLRTLRARDDTSRVIEPLTQFADKLATFAGQTSACPICFNDFVMESGASLINPCWHIVCDTCLRTMIERKNSACDLKCPLCRGTVEGHTTALIDNHGATTGTSNCKTAAGAAAGAGAETAAAAAAAVDGRRTLLQNLSAVVKPTAGLERACVDTLRCIQADVGRHTPYKIVMIVPDERFFTKFVVDVRAEMEASQVDIIEFKTQGNKRKHVTANSVGSQISNFASNEGPPLKILFTTEGKTDSLTGLDFPWVDCILSLGDGNTLQRLGRLTRLPRMLDEAADGSKTTMRYIRLDAVC